MKTQIENVDVDLQGVVNAQTITELQQQVNTIRDIFYSYDTKYTSDFRTKMPPISLREILFNIHNVFYGFSKDTTNGNTTILIDTGKIIPSIKKLINFDPKIEELLKKLYLDFSTIYESLNYTNGSFKTIIYNIRDSVGNLAKSPSKEKIEKLIQLIQPAITNISKLDGFDSKIKTTIEDLKKVLLSYKNAFITLSFQIASTLFGYRISVLQILMQNFPEQMNNFNQDMVKPSTPNYGLTELDKLKTPFNPFVGAGDVENQEFKLSDYELSLLSSSPPFNPTPFNILLPLGDKLSNVPSFEFNMMAKLLRIPERESTILLMGGKKQRRLLSSPTQQKKRPKKRKTIKNKLNSVKKTSNKKKTIKKGNRKRKMSIQKAV
jgi:hypothetical protein